ncbi:hypothetical protein AB4076_11110 [Dyella sp. 2RAF44]|uniref:hypothetical protein n=1 Tax=Dyella sp. 2RAF44 TaxID=3233000 RepID=UPI003F9059C4
MTKNRFQELLAETRDTPTLELSVRVNNLGEQIREQQAEHAALNRVLKCRRRKSVAATTPRTIH